MQSTIDCLGDVQLNHLGCTKFFDNRTPEVGNISQHISWSAVSKAVSPNLYKMIFLYSEGQKYKKY